MPMTYYTGEFDNSEIQGQLNMGRFMKILLVKRLESSFYAFTMSIDRFMQSYRAFIDMYKNGEVLVSKKVNVYDLLDEDDGAKIEQLIADDKVERYKVEQFRDEYYNDLVADLGRLEEIKTLWEGLVSFEKDEPKVNSFIDKLKNENADSLITCVRSKRFFWNDDNLPINYDPSNRPRRQDFKGTLMENGAFYISNVGSIIKHKNRVSGRVSIFEMNEYQGIELDEENDWLNAENLMHKYNSNDQIISNIKLVLSDVDGTLTDSGMYYSSDGNELKKFNVKMILNILITSISIKTTPFLFPS
jgi:hypothetical protein